jgi:hypothetical protein
MLRDDGLSRRTIMPTYLVRTIDDHDLVGIFVAPNLFELALLLDEGIDAGVCECQRMGAGGIMWTEPAVAVPVNDDDETSSDPVPWAEASLTEAWECSVYGPSNGKWRAITFNLEEVYPEEPDDSPSPQAPVRTGTARILPYRKRAT